MSETAPEWNKQDPLSPRVSELYLQQVNTAQFVLALREAVDKTLESGAQYATVIGAMHMMIREIGDRAIAQMEDSDGHVS